VNIFVLSRNSRLYSTRRLVEAAQKRKHDVYVRDPLKFTIQVKDPPDLSYLSRPIVAPDAVIPRIGASITYFGCAVVRQFEQMGVFALNDSNGIASSRDKLAALQLLSRHHLLLPKTAVVRRKHEILKAIDEIGGVPVVIKLIEGTQGVGVVLAKDKLSAQAIIELLQSAKQNILVQKFVAESSGRDIRAFVVGGKIVAAMRRISTNPSEFRANVHRGAKAEGIKLSPDFEKAALKAAEILGLNVAGVDLLESHEGPLVLEVNSSPGLEAIERASGVDIADEIIQFIEKKVSRKK
jgi:ribosomal protein S6--L-glutamate ligase